MYLDELGPGVWSTRLEPYAGDRSRLRRRTETFGEGQAVEIHDDLTTPILAYNPNRGGIERRFGSLEAAISRLINTPFGKPKKKRRTYFASHHRLGRRRARGRFSRTIERHDRPEWGR